MAQNGSKAFSLGGVQVHIPGILEAEGFLTLIHTSNHDMLVFCFIHSLFLANSWWNLTVWINEYLSIRWGFVYIFLEKKNSVQSPVFFWLYFIFLSYSTNLRVVPWSPGHDWPTKGLKALEEDDSFYTTVYSVSAEVLPDAWREGLMPHGLGIYVWYGWTPPPQKHIREKPWIFVCSTTLYTYPNIL